MLVALLALGTSSSGCGDNLAAADAASAMEAAPESSDASAADATAPDSGASELHVLFIGNSYTYVNDLPGMLMRIATTGGTPPSITTDSVVQGGATLSDHWANGIAQARIAEGTWSHVVLQGQSLEALYPRDNDFATYALRFGELVIGAGARPALFVTWARAASDSAYDPSYGQWVSPDELQDQITDGYTDVARQLPGSVLACVGEAFRATVRDHPEIVLHQSDNSHPTVAGTYLAASTFYVALTGAPVPGASEVPDGVSAADAEALRAEALVGTNCAFVALRAAVRLRTETGTTCPLDFGILGTPLPRTLYLWNSGFAAADITDAQTLGPPFRWSAGGTYPGGAGAAPSNGGQFHFCGASLAAGDTCVMAVTYQPDAAGSSTLTLDLAGAYEPDVSCALTGTSTTRALLTVSEGSSFFGCSDAVCQPVGLSCYAGAGASTSFVVSNRGGAAAVALGPGEALAPPFHWGTSVDSTFPGGSGTGTVEGVGFPYCGPTLEAGAQCLVTVSFLPTDIGPQVDTAVDLAYADAVGPVTLDARRSLTGQVSTLPP